jgi:UDP-N-acetylmuramoyl-tripeptide--D-alanyl-D-alanine ligase
MDIAALYERYLSSMGVTTDTRQIKQGCIFFALRGEKFNANTFAIEAVEKGAAYAVIDEAQPDSERYHDKLILVTDVLATLQELSGYHRQQLRCPVLAITGSNGKTTTKELIAAVLSKKIRTVATRGNLNNHIGVPLTLLGTPVDTEFLIIEMGANHLGEIAGYCVYADPDFGLITNVGKAHLEGFGSEEGVMKGKTELYAHIAGKQGKLFVSSLSPVLKKKATEYVTSEDIVYYGSSKSDYCSGENVSSGEFLTVKAKDGLIIKTQLVGGYNFENTMAAICIGRYFGVDDMSIKEAIESYVPSNNRSQKITSGSNTILLDAYNANPSSMMEALKNFEKLETSNKITILGQMMELGAYSHDEHIKIVDMVNQMHLSQRVYVGEGFKMTKGNDNALYFETTEQLKDWYTAQHFENTTQLIKGSRKNALEKIVMS